MPNRAIEVERAGEHNCWKGPTAITGSVGASDQLYRELSSFGAVI
jgi:hypothetical protein